MEQVSADKRTAAHVMFTTGGLCAMLLLLLWNPFVLRSRLWSATTVIRSLSIDAMLLLIGAGLIRLRRSAALLASVLAIHVAIDFASTSAGPAVATLSLLIPLLAMVFWRDLTWGNMHTDLPFALASVTLCVLVQCAALAIHHG